MRDYFPESDNRRIGGFAWMWASAEETLERAGFNKIITYYPPPTPHTPSLLRLHNPPLERTNDGFAWSLQMVDNKINKFRHVILEILHRLPNNEVLKPHVQELLLLVMSVVDSDNEDNAIQGLRVVFDLQKNYRPQLESEVPRWLQVRKPSDRDSVP